MGACISEYLRAKGQEDLRGVLFQNETAFRDTQAFLLYSADFSGVQKFIYTIAASDALRTLRSRSFFLDFAMEHYVDELLGACGVSRANLLYSGGGHCYLLLPNTDGVRAAADAWKHPVQRMAVCPVRHPAVSGPRVHPLHRQPAHQHPRPGGAL